MENNVAKEWLSNRGYGSGTNLTIDRVAHLLTVFASHQKPAPSDLQKEVETIKSDNSKVNANLFEEVERLKELLEKAIHNLPDTAVKSYLKSQLTKP